MRTNNRTVFLTGGVESDLTERVIRDLFSLINEQSTDPILLVVNSYGGSVRCMHALLDTIRMAIVPVNVLVLGQAYSAAAILTILAEPGRRLATPTSTFMVHGISTSSRGGLSEIREEVRRVNQLEQDQRKEILERTCLSRSELNKLMRTERVISADEALAFGMIDRIITRFDQIPQGNKPCKKSRKGNAS